MPNLEHLKTESKFNRKPTTLDREQLEYFKRESADNTRTYFTYGVILFAVALGLGSVTYMTIQQLKK